MPFESPFLQAEQPQFPHPLFIRLVLQILHKVPLPSLDTSVSYFGERGLGHTSAEYSGTALVLLATLLLVQAKMPLAFLVTWVHIGSCPVVNQRK